MVECLSFLELNAPSKPPMGTCIVFTVRKWTLSSLLIRTWHVQIKAILGQPSVQLEADINVKYDIWVVSK